MARKPEKPTTELPSRRVGQKIFREWCAEFGAVVDVMMAADLARRISDAIDRERIAAAITTGKSDGQG